MSRLNRVVQQKENAVLKRNVPRKDKTVPVYDISGKTVNPEKKKRDRNLGIVLLVVTAFVAFIYMPQLFISETEKSKTVKVDIDSSAISLSSTALKGSPSRDFDGDGIENSEETVQGTNPWQIDSDGDGLTDYCEIYITKTDPTSADEGYLVDEQKKSDSQKDKNLGSPYRIGNVILWADDYTSKAYGSIVKTTAGYRVCGFNGYIQLPESDGKYAYKVENGIRSKLEYLEDEDVWKVEDGDTIEVYEEELEEIVDFSFFGKHFYTSNNFLTGFMSNMLPNSGFVTATKKTKTDVEPDTRKSVTTDIKEVEYDKKDTTRFTMNTCTLNDLQYVRETINEKDSCVAVSLYDPSEGEFIAIVYGYTYEGDLLLADKNSKQPLGVLSITEKARKMMNEEGSLVSYSYFDFEGMGFSSQNGDRISFFADNSSGSNNMEDNKSEESDESSGNSASEGSKQGVE